MKKLQLLVDIDENCVNIATQTNEEVVVMIGSGSKSTDIERAKRGLEFNAKKLLVARGIDVNALENYHFGKSMSFALCYGASLERAKSCALQSVKRINFSGIASNELLIRSFVNDPTKYTMYDNIVKAVYSGKFEKARKSSVDTWKKRLAKNLVEDSETLKKLVVNGCIPRNSVVQSTTQRGTTEVTLEFIEQIVEVVNQI